MNPEVLRTFVPREPAGSTAKLFTPIPVIRVLVYTDDPEQVKDDKDIGMHIGLMKKFLSANQPAFANVEVDLLSRNVLDASQSTVTEEGHAKEMLTGSLLMNYHQVWFFGIHLSNLSALVWNGDFKQRGGPKSELTDPEVESLRIWMGSDVATGGQMGGVLVAGDHSIKRPATAVPSTLPDTLSLGRALSRRVPRAHQLRTWEGGPLQDPPNNFNTQDPAGACDPDALELNLNQDSTPQRLILPRLNGKCPNDLFIGKDGKVLDVYPDHPHEGEVIVTDDTNPPDGDWPSGGPQPVVVAYGTDKRKPVIYKIVAAYDGDTVGVGRIASDSSWHHFFNDTLIGFDADTSAGSVADRLGQYYSNLAVWLSPLPMRRTMARAMIWWLVNHPLVAVEAGGGAMESTDGLLEVGKIARTLLERVAGPSEIHALLSAYAPASLQAGEAALHYPTGGLTLTPLPSRELVLGSIISSYYQDSTGAAPANGAEGGTSALINKGLAKAFDVHAKTLSAVSAQALANINNL